MKQLLTKIYLYRILSEFTLLYPLYTVMFAEKGGLSLLQISTMLAIWSIIILVFEIPSGALADKYSRRNLLGLAQFIRAGGFLLWIVWPTFEGFLLGLGLWGLGRSLTSGTFEALVYDELKALGQEKRYAKTIGQTESFALFIGLGATLAAAGVFAGLGYDGVVWLSIATTLISGGIALTLPNKQKKTSTEVTLYSTILRQALSEVRHNHTLIKVIIFGVFVGMLFRVFDEYASLILKAADIPTVWIPLVSALVFLPVIVADFFAYKLENAKQVTFVFMLISAGVGLILTSKWLGPLGLVGFATFLLLVKLSITLFGAKVQHAIQGTTRATITSINNFGVEIAAVAAFFVYGTLTTIGATSLALLIFGVAACSVGILYLLFTQGRVVRGLK